MTKYTTMQTLFVQLNVLNNPMKHQSNGYGWEIADCMFEQVLKQTKIIVVGANFFFLNADEVTIIDNQSQILVHVYVMHAWKGIHILLTLECVVEGGNANNLTVVIIQTLMQQGGLTQKKSPKG